MQGRSLIVEFSLGKPTRVSSLSGSEPNVVRVVLTPHRVAPCQPLAWASSNFSSWLATYSLPIHQAATIRMSPSLPMLEKAIAQRLQQQLPQGTHIAYGLHCCSQQQLLLLLRLLVSCCSYGGYDYWAIKTVATLACAVSHVWSEHGGAIAL